MQGLFDLQAGVSFNSQGNLSWLNPMLLKDVKFDSLQYQNILCPTPLTQGYALGCQYFYGDYRRLVDAGNSIVSDACLKSITQFTPSQRDGVQLASMLYAGRAGSFKGTNKFAITPTGYLLALRSGSKCEQNFDWWKPDGSYGGQFTLKWKKKRGFLGFGRKKCKGCKSWSSWGADVKATVTGCRYDSWKVTLSSPPV